jgi:L-serine dehydratase
MEHNPRLTCNPISGLVQIPSIGRNAMGAMKASNAGHLALRGDGRHVVSLDKVLKTMRQAETDVLSGCKETSRGGLPIDVTGC